MRLLTTGGGGQLGRSIASVVADRKTVEAVFPDRAELDISDSAAIAAAIDRYAPDAVINCAAYTAVDNAEDNEAEAFAINAAAAGSLAAACAHAAVPLIHISTDYVFDGAKTAPYSESDPTCPVSVYGRSKLEGERRVAAAAPRHVILRTAWVHSEYGANFVKTMLRLAADRDTVSVVADQYGSPTYAPHLAAAIVALAHRISDDPGTVPWGVFHAAGRGETNWAGLAREIFARAREHSMPAAAVTDIMTGDYPTKAARPANSRLDCGALEAAFGVRLPHWKDGVRECVRALAGGPDEQP
ncbi:MAG: dTDP-4-dehydrorhamnose reductase [Rhodobiaceae bacterium]|nr:dTDP-4-dehydrorhamnose reductase [Rhodobiaceae bacterium]MCC0048120.1 dTDP-4-dehydrorhamnose reductase [Rhodobiaceae bacterium]